PFLKSLPPSLQHLFAMFGSTILVPVLFGVNPATILFMNGVGTLIYIFITKGKIPAYLGSSFAFISPVFVVLNMYGGDGYSYLVLSWIISCWDSFVSCRTSCKNSRKSMDGYSLSPCWYGGNCCCNWS